MPSRCSARWTAGGVGARSLNIATGVTRGKRLRRAMAVAVVPREDNAFANGNPPPARNAILARYRQLREISKRHHHDILKLTSGNAMLQQARRLGLAREGR
jgi:hypothetical protein